MAKEVIKSEHQGLMQTIQASLSLYKLLIPILPHVPHPATQHIKPDLDPS